MSYKLWVMNVNRPKFIHADFITHITTASVCTEYLFQMIRLFHTLTRIRYVPRSDTNFIIPGNHYRLEYWDGFSWQCVGEKTATDYYLDFQKVPAGKLYILHDLSGGA